MIITAIFFYLFADLCGGVEAKPEQEANWVYMP
jgi:hypothetical protein